MRWVFAVIVAIHGLIHLVGVAKAFGLAELPQLALPISRPMGVVWLAAALVSLAAAVGVVAWPRWWWLVGAAALVLSQVAVVASWQDAKFGTLVNVLILLGVAHGYLVHGPQSFEATFRRDAATLLSRTAPPAPIAQSELDALPQPVRRYLGLSGVVAGTARPSTYEVHFRGRIRSGPDAAWMGFEAEQQSATTPPARLFLMRATMYGLPVEAFHRLVDGHATMQVRLLGAIPIADARGDAMDRAESVTLLNDMALLAPASLLDPAIAWEPIDASTVGARFSHGGGTVSATLLFDAEGRLANFVSDDRSRASEADADFTPCRFSTPVTAYASGAPLRLEHAEARWHPPEGEFVYFDSDIVSIQTRPAKP
jgi:hypothetical protein